MARPGRALYRIEKSKTDFVFLYMVETDETCGEEYTVIITADHGGHDRGHGSDMPEDTTIPTIDC